MRIKYFTAALLLATFFYDPVNCQNINQGKLDSLFNILAEKNKAMGSQLFHSKLLSRINLNLTLLGSKWNSILIKGNLL